MNEIIDVVPEVVPETKAPEMTLKGLLSPARGSEESYEDYKQRRKTANQVIKGAMKNGTTFYDPRKNNMRPYHKETK